MRVFKGTMAAHTSDIFADKIAAAARNGGSAGGGSEGGGGSDGGGGKGGGGDGGGGDGGGGDGAGITTKADVGRLGVVVTGTPMKMPLDAVNEIAFDMLAVATCAAAKEKVSMMAVT